MISKNTRTSFFRVTAPILFGCFVSLVIFASCSTDRKAGDLLIPQDIGTLVVDGLLVVGEPFPEIFLTRTLSPIAPFNLEAVLVRDAQVFRIQGGFQRIEYEERPFWYQPNPTDRTELVQENTTYRLTVHTARDEELTAVTTTPPRFAVRDWVILNDEGTAVDSELATFEDTSSSPDSVYWENTLVYSRGLLEAQFDRPDVPAFQVGIESLDLESDFVIDPDFFDEEDFEDLERIGSSPPLVTSDGHLRLPWFAIYFAGRYKVKVFAMDDNWYDLARSLPDFGGGPGFGGQAGDSFERPIFRVEGGIGLFGSASVDSVGFFVLPE